MTYFLPHRKISFSIMRKAHSYVENPFSLGHDRLVLRLLKNQITIHFIFGPESPRLKNRVVDPNEGIFKYSPSEGDKKQFPEKSLLFSTSN